MVFLFPPLCCKPAAGLGSEGEREASGQEEEKEEVEVVILQKTTFLQMKAVQQEEEEEEEKGRALQHLCHLLAASLCWVQFAQVLGSEGLRLGQRPPLEHGLCRPPRRKAQTTSGPLSFV